MIAVIHDLTKDLSLEELILVMNEASEQGLDIALDLAKLVNVREEIRDLILDAAEV